MFGFTIEIIPLCWLYLFAGCDQPVTILVKDLMKESKKLRLLGGDLGDSTTQVLSKFIVTYYNYQANSAVIFLILDVLGVLVLRCDLFCLSKLPHVLVFLAVSY